MRWLGGMALAVAAIFATAARAEPVTVSDIIGREVTLAAPARRIVLAQGRQISGLAFILRDPTRVIAGMGGDFRRQDPASFELYRKAFPAIDAVPTVGEGTAETLSIEKIVALQPDLVVLSRSLIGARRTGQQASDVIERLEAAGLKVAVVDLYLHPVEDTVKSLRILGRLVGEQQRAEDFALFYEARLARIRDRIAGRERPAVFMQAHAGGTDCCFSPGRGTFNDLIEAAGGRNIAAGLLPGISGQLSLEMIISTDPAHYVATGGVHLARRGGLVLGYGVPADTAKTTFERLLSDQGIASIGAVGRGRAHAFAQLFNDSPLHIVGIEVMAKWFHPELFGDIDPQATIDEINRRFLAVPAIGTFWLDGRNAAR